MGKSNLKEKPGISDKSHYLVIFFPGPEIKYTRITAGDPDNEEKLKKILEEG